ncbi:MAG: TonB-dependent receptor plug domain-containing protein, partial [Alphaproteobacteria bacterium]|nr:TonB-dependent receptor plug domain-containing protein [Alphaproteobacteria bacterium]
MRYAYFCCLLSIFCFTAATSDTLTLHTPATLPTIIVKDIKKAAFKKDVLTWEAVEKESPRTLVDVLKNVNGIYITQSGGATSASSLFLRGGNPNHTLVLSDGMRSMDPTVVNGSFNAGVWIASDFDVITVKKGPLSSLHGSDAVAGVISTEMAKGEDRQTTISTLHGSFDTH